MSERLRNQRQERARFKRTNWLARPINQPPIGLVPDRDQIKRIERGIEPHGDERIEIGDRRRRRAG
jgi:hypothetical protein